MALNFITSPNITEDRCRNYISKMFINTSSMIDAIFEQAQTDIIKAKFKKESKDIIIDLIEIKINNLLSKFEDIIFQFNHKYKQNLEVPFETFSYKDKLEYLLKLEPIITSNINMDAID
jgi:hypothetical protein